jgi:hypothetical protein
MVCIHKHNWIGLVLGKLHKFREVMLMLGECPFLLPFAGLGLSLAPVEAAARRMVLRPASAAPRRLAARTRPQERAPWGYVLLCRLSRETRGR